MPIDKRAYYQISAVAEQYEKKRFFSRSGQLTHEAEISVLKSIFQPQEEVLELACGTGRLLRHLQKAGWQIRGVDQSMSMLEQGKRGGVTNVVQGDVLSLPFPDASFDGAYSFRFTNHCPDLPGFFRECYRILRPQGHFVFDTMRWSPLWWESVLLGGRNFVFSNSYVEQQLRKTGFSIRSWQPLFPIGPYLLSKLPFVLGKCLLSARSYLPFQWQAIMVWHVQKS